MGYVRHLENNFLLLNKSLRLKVLSYSIGDTLDIGYMTFGDAKSIRRFKGILIAKIKSSTALMQRLIMIKRVKGVSIKFGIDINNPKVSDIKLLIRTSIIVRRSKYTTLKYNF